MDTLEALRKAIQEELYYDDKLRGRMLNIIDAAMEHEKKKPKAEFDVEEMRQRVRRNTGRPRTTQEATEERANRIQEETEQEPPTTFNWTTIGMDDIGGDG